MAAIGFSSISNTPRRTYAACALAAATGHAVRFMLMSPGWFGMNIIPASAVAAFVVGLLAVLMAPMVKCPAEVCLFPALLPMIPGMYAYKTVFSMIMFMQNLDDPSAAGYLAAIVRNGFVTFSVIFMLAAGAAAPIFLFNKRAHSLTRNKKQIRS